jgi:hypothetical protein
VTVFWDVSPCSQILQTFWRKSYLLLEVKNELLGRIGTDTRRGNTELEALREPMVRNRMCGPLELPFSFSGEIGRSNNGSE